MGSRWRPILIRFLGSRAAKRTEPTFDSLRRALFGFSRLSAYQFDSRYATFGFNDTANLDDGAMWPTSFALKKFTAADEKKIAAHVKKAVS